MTAHRVGSAILVSIALALQGMGQIRETEHTLRYSPSDRSPKQLFKTSRGCKAYGRGPPLEESVRKYGASLLQTP